MAFCTRGSARTPSRRRWTRSGGSRPSPGERSARAGPDGAAYRRGRLRDGELRRRPRDLVIRRERRHVAHHDVRPRGRERQVRRQRGRAPGGVSELADASEPAYPLYSSPSCPDLAAHAPGPAAQSTEITTAENEPSAANCCRSSVCCPKRGPVPPGFASTSRSPSKPLTAVQWPQARPPSATGHRPAHPATSSNETGLRLNASTPHRSRSTATIPAPEASSRPTSLLQYRGDSASCASAGVTAMPIDVRHHIVERMEQVQACTWSSVGVLVSN